MTEVKQNPIIQWAEGRPVWEKFLWKICLENGILTDGEVDETYSYFLVENKIENDPALPKIDLTGLLPTEEKPLPRIYMQEIKDCKHINAIPDGQIIKFGKQLTLVYGGNGSGKSGFGRLIANACYSKGRIEKKIWHNLKKGNSGIAEANFVLEGGKTFKYVNNGKAHQDLKRFSVFDSASVPIHLNGSNTVQFTPGQVQIFDLINKYISEIEERFAGEKTAKFCENPVENTFLDEASDVSILLTNLSEGNTKDEIEKATKFGKDDEKKLKALLEELKAKIKLNVPEKKQQLNDEKNYLTQYKKNIENYLGNLSEKHIGEINKLIKDVVVKQELVKNLGAANFNNGIFKTIGTEKWQALLISAKELYNAEKKASKNAEIKNCLLCHQELGKKELTLYEAYWKFLENTAEEELEEAKDTLNAKLGDIENLQITSPGFDDTQPAIKILKKVNAGFIKDSKDAVTRAKRIFKNWEVKIQAKKAISVEKIKALNYEVINSAVSVRKKEAEELKDPTSQIDAIEEKILQLEHQKKAKKIKAKILTYWEYLKWYSKAAKVQFPKASYTKQRKVIFNQIVTDEYKTTFNKESKSLDSEFGLTVESRGASGDTLLEFKLDFASGHKPTDVLSEGEQKVSAIADFFTEVQLNKNNCGIIFDDPVTSLDHERKEKIAERIVLEAKVRQVIVFTHDLVFMSKLVHHVAEGGIELEAHWVKRGHDGSPGLVEHNKNPKLSNLKSLKKDAEDAVIGFDSLGEKEKEKAIGVALDYLRSACEAIAIELLFAGVIKRYDDHIKMQNIEEMPFNKEHSLELVSLHGKLSELILAHNRSDEMREKLISIKEYKEVRKTFDELESKIRDDRKKAVTEREGRKKKLQDATKGWS